MHAFPDCTRVFSLFVMAARCFLDPTAAAVRCESIISPVPSVVRLHSSHVALRLILFLFSFALLSSVCLILIDSNNACP